MYQFNVKYSVLEVRENLAKMVRRGLISEARMISIVKKFAKEKATVQEGQKFIVIMEEV